MIQTCRTRGIDLYSMGWRATHAKKDTLVNLFYIICDRQCSVRIPATVPRRKKSLSTRLACIGPPPVMEGPTDERIELGLRIEAIAHRLHDTPLSICCRDINYVVQDTQTKVQRFLSFMVFPVHLDDLGIDRSTTSRFCGCGMVMSDHAPPSLSSSSSPDQQTTFL